ncbi:MAG: MotA/TolQ/ExbB proton channel family protein [Alphaproteobacteria bacterium GM202ARS2]|nr:MotA/TolQ/ExbB proton channel family protein [Alphaproteobacteria bacterium GM202ARS2]
MVDMVDVWQRGGVIMYILFFLSVLSVSVVLFKAVHFYGMGLRDWRFVEDVKTSLAAGKNEQALRALAGHRHPLARVLEVVVRAHMHRLDEDSVESALQRVAYGQVHRLRSYVSVLELIAQAAPLIGLLGTVIGMIEAFSALEQAGARADPSVFAGGIWTALLTTAAGLIVAIPSLFFFHTFVGMIERTMSRIGNVVADIKWLLSEREGAS